jgi:WS/DGAT/MGAT family acyltransferase
VALIQKIHHSIIDRRSGVELFSVIFDLEPAARNTPVEKEPGEVDRIPSELELLARSYLSYIFQPFKIAGRFADTAKSFFHAGAQMVIDQVGLSPFYSAAPKALYNGNVCRNCNISLKTFSLDTVKTIKKAIPGSTVNDVVLALCGGAMRRYLMKQGKLPHKPLVATVPISIQSAKKKGNQDQRLALARVSLATNLNDPLERFDVIFKSVRESKAYNKAINADSITGYNQYSPFAIATLASRFAAQNSPASRFASHSNLMIANVPGPQVPLYFAGAKALLTTASSPILQGNRPVINVQSCLGQMTFCTTSCPDSMPNAKTFPDCLQEELDALLTAVAGSGARKSVKPIGTIYQPVSKVLVKPPSKTFLMLEFARTPWEMGAHYLARSILSLAPKGDGHMVMAIPGFLANDLTTKAMRMYLNRCGYQTSGWKQGTNYGYSDKVGGNLVWRVSRLFKKHGKISLVGQSLGGVYACELARMYPHMVRFVITLGSPYADIENASNVMWLYNRINGKEHGKRFDYQPQRCQIPPPVPTTSVYSKTDGIVSWRSSDIDKHHNGQCESVEILGSHIGMSFNPHSLWVVANRLAQSEDDWQPFEPTGREKYFYRSHSRVQTGEIQGNPER